MSHVDFSTKRITFHQPNIKQKKSFSVNKSALHCISICNQKEHSVKTLFFLLYAEFWKHCVLSGKTHTHPLPQHQSKNENFTLNRYIITTNGDRTHISHAYNHTPVPLRHN